MVLYARSDVVGVGVPLDGGGCGQFHSRPVVDGNPVKLFAVDCPACETHLRARLPDQWTPDRWRIPLTPDEEAQVEALQAQADALQQLESRQRASDMAQRLAVQSSSGGPSAPPVVPAPLSPPADSAETSAQLAERDADLDLSTLTVAQLKVKCREAGVAATGTKPELVARLSG